MFVSLSCQHTFVAVDRDGSLCRQGTNREFGSAQSVDRLLRAVDTYGILDESKLISKFVSDPILEVFVSFSLWVLCLHFEGCCNLLCSLENNLER